ncbi:hypothetical protein BH09ACT7_BH09ACT7_51740 [soil metagenome]
MSLYPKIARLTVAALLLAPALSACSPTVVMTDEGAAADAAPSPGAPMSTLRPNNANLVNAFDFYGEAAGHPGYFFTSPSGAWRCLITPHQQAGCQSAKSTTRLGITGAPDTVTDPDGTEVVPNTLLIASTGDAHFARLDTAEAKPAQGPAPTLQFGKILAAAGFRCNVQDLGISCMSEDSGQGFTFSADGYLPSYTDLPAAS